jgi:hypothetical protein
MSARDRYREYKDWVDTPVIRLSPKTAALIIGLIASGLAYVINWKSGQEDADRKQLDLSTQQAVKLTMLADDMKEVKNGQAVLTGRVTELLREVRSSNGTGNTEPTIIQWKSGDVATAKR